MENVIEVEGLTKRYGPVQALGGITFQVPRGSIVGFVGPNGAGKTTTMRILLDILRPTAGHVKVLGQSPRRGGGALRAHMGYLPGELNLDPHTSVESLLAYYASLSGAPTPSWRELASRLGLDLKRQVSKLSKGNRQKVGLVQALAHNPEVVILDEPSSGLDPLVQHEFRTLLLEAQQKGQTVLLSSHVLSEVESVADHLIVLREGLIAVNQSMSQVREAIAREVTVTFAHPPLLDEYEGLGLQKARVSGRVMSAELAGPVQPLLAKLATVDVADVRIARPDLEASVMNLYHSKDA